MSTASKRYKEQLQKSNGQKVEGQKAAPQLDQQANSGQLINSADQQANSGQLINPADQQANSGQLINPADQQANLDQQDNSNQSSEKAADQSSGGSVLPTVLAGFATVGALLLAGFYVYNKLNHHGGGQLALEGPNAAPALLGYDANANGAGFHKVFFDYSKLNEQAFLASEIAEPHHADELLNAFNAFNAFDEELIDLSPPRDIVGFAN